MHGGVTPVMYSSFWDDANTTQELIKLGADIHKKDEYKLSAMAYAIENNATNTVKLLLDNGVKFEEVKAIQWYLDCPIYKIIKLNIIVDENGIHKTHNFADCIVRRDGPKGDVDSILYYAISNGLTEIAEIAFKQGMKPDPKYIHTYYINYKVAKDISFQHSVYTELVDLLYYKSMLDLLVKYNIAGIPTQEEFIMVQEQCLNSLLGTIKKKISYINHMNDYCYGEKPDIKILNFYNMKIDRYKALCGNGLSDEEILQKSSLKDKNSTEAFDIETFFKYLNFEEMLEEAKVKILHNGEKIDIKDYAEILRQEAAKKLDSNQ